MMSMNIVAPCAHTASWGEALERIATQIGVHAYPQIEVRAPAVARMIEEAMNMCRTIGVDPEQKVREATTAKQTDLQKQWAVEAQTRAKDRLMGEYQSARRRQPPAGPALATRRRAALEDPARWTDRFCCAG